jgi:glycosyltransferase involved in cell wall biosynthesis
MTGPPPRLAALYPSTEPALSRFFFAWHQLEPVRGISFERANEFLQIALGIYPHDPMRPHRMWIPSSAPRWRPRWHGRWFQRLTREARVVFLTRPEQAALLPFLAGRAVAYYAIDDYRHYGHFRAEDERAIVHAAAAIFVCSPALAEKFMQDYAVPPERLTVLPMGILARHLPAACPTAPAPVPGGLSPGRPLFGVIGAINYRLRFDWLLHCVEALPWSHWLFVGYLERGRLSAAEAATLQQLQRHPRCTFTGARDYDALPAYAAAVDAAVIPYNDRTTNPCASPMRLFLQLPFGAPIVAAPGCRALADFQPNLRLCATAVEMAAALEQLRAVHFDDGRRLARWTHARTATWEFRAETARRVLRPWLDAAPAAP